MHKNIEIKYKSGKMFMRNSGDSEREAIIDSFKQMEKHILKKGGSVNDIVVKSVDFRFLDISKAEFVNYVFKNCDFRMTNFSSCNFKNVEFDSCDFNCCDIRASTFENCKFKGDNLAFSLYDGIVVNGESGFFKFENKLYTLSLVDSKLRTLNGEEIK